MKLNKSVNILFNFHDCINTIDMLITKACKHRMAERQVQDSSETENCLVPMGDPGPRSDELTMSVVAFRNNAYADAP